MTNESSTRARRSTERNLSDKGARDVLGGALKPNDPRRYLVEAMIGAMNADGVVDDREMAVLHHHVENHDLFAGVSPTAAKTMIDLAADAVRFAGDPLARIPAIARGLPSRVVRSQSVAGTSPRSVTRNTTSPLSAAARAIIAMVAGGNRSVPVTSAIAKPPSHNATQACTVEVSSAMPRRPDM